MNVMYVLGWDDVKYAVNTGICVVISMPTRRWGQPPERTFRIGYGIVTVNLK